MLRIPVLALALLATGLAAAAGAQERSPWEASKDTDLEIKLVTFGPGGSVHQYFGHNAMVVQDARRGTARLYNFGMFSFGADMLPKYLQGRLEFWVAATAVRRTFRHYAAMDRSITVQELDLAPKRRRLIADRLAWNALPENRDYLYHHYRDNCSTRLRDLLNEAVGGQMQEQHAKSARLTYRGHTRRYTEHDPIVHMLLFFWMNDSMERPIRSYDEAFLPDELARVAAETTYVDDAGASRKLVRLTYPVYEARRAPVPHEPSTLWPHHLLAGLLVGALALLASLWWRGSRRPLPRVLLGLLNMAVGLVLGVPSLIAFLFIFTEWEVTYWNENLWVANSLTFLALPAGLLVCRGSRRAVRFLWWCWSLLSAGGLLLCLLKLLPNFDQATHLTLALVLPVNLGFAAGFWLLSRARADGPQ